VLTTAFGPTATRGPVCLGDSFIATNVPLLDAKTRRRVGSADALETVFGRQGEYWTLTARLAVPVVGGTGIYANTRGTMSFAEIGETGRARLTFNLAW
jgi:hypothetical protein